MAEPEEVDEQWSDAHDTVEDDDQSVRLHPSPRGIEEIRNQEHDEMTIGAVKITTSHGKMDAAQAGDSQSPRSLSPIRGRSSDAASVRSLPVVHVTEPQSPMSATLQTPESANNLSAQPAPSSPTRSHMSTTVESTTSDRDRRLRHRSAVEVRSSNRLSGFFNNLIHRRDHPPNGPSRLAREDHPPPSPNVPANSNPPSRPSTPPPPRSITPPPQLPAPTLQELGLSFSVITSDLSPSHFSTPPTSGTFLGPHYLLLCHAQGLDVLPLVAPPSPQPYALVRRVCFKSVVVMEQRGVLVAIAGRRDGVRVYALEEVKKAVEWRIEVEVRRERERTRRETAKRMATGSIDSFSSDQRDSSEKKARGKVSIPPSAAAKVKGDRNVSYPGATPPMPQPSRVPVVKVLVSSPTSESLPAEASNEGPLGRPPPYTSPTLRAQASTVSIRQNRPRSASITNVLAGVPPLRRNGDSDARRPRDPDSKADWAEARDSSDDEAINIVAAASSGSQALDERTSAMGSPNLHSSLRLEAQTVDPLPCSPTLNTARRGRPPNLDLSASRASTAIASAIPAEPSPAPTLLTLRQALSHPPPTLASLSLAATRTAIDSTNLNGDGEDDEEEEGRITLAQALLESRIPELPPAGTRRPQAPILITSSHPVVTGDEDLPGSPRSSEHSTGTRRSADPERRRRRWSVLDGMFTNGIPNLPTVPPSPSVPSPLRDGAPTAAPASRSPGGRIVRSQSQRNQSTPPASVAPLPSSVNPPAVPPIPRPSLPAAQAPNARSRFIPRIISNAFHSRRSGEEVPVPAVRAVENDSRKSTSVQLVPHAPPPKLEYVKLPGTKGALMIKAVETPKKSFLAILCGESGEKVELFAGTYRTALGLSRTFILPDSPRSLELQLQGDDLVEVFLVFSQNVFGLEPATVRVREVRIGRAERRAARRRAREIRTGEPSTHDPEAAILGEEDTNVNVSIGVSVSAGAVVSAPGEGPESPSFQPRQHPADSAAAPPETNNSTALTHAEEIVALATVQMGPYTTFQQLSFAPNFPLASIADEYIIPPTYPTFLDYRSEYEPEINGSNNTDLSQIQFSPPGLPVPTPSAPSKWFYRDPKGVVHGPWKASLMQAWYKDGLLPPDLPLRRDEDTDYTLLKELRLQCVDPAHPFRSTPPLAEPSSVSLVDGSKPLLPPLSLLSQPKHFGPPALFYSSRGGHSTTIVDARGRSVLKGRFVWSGDDQPDDSNPSTHGRMGDVKRLEAFDVNNRSILVAMRQGGLEAVDLGDALLKPADESRMVLPQFMPPPSNTNRRCPYVWKIGSPVSSSPTSATVLTSKFKGGYTGKKQVNAATRSPVGKTEFSLGASGSEEAEIQDEVLFLGRKEDEIYICERNSGAFRILRLCPNPL